MQISFSDRPLLHPFAPPRIALLSKVSIGKFKSHFTIGLNLNSNAVLPLGHKMLCSSRCVSVCVCVGEHLLLLFVLVLVKYQMLAVSLSRWKSVLWLSVR